MNMTPDFPEWPEAFDKTDAPREPNADLTKAAGSIHELYVSFIRAGFREDQALAILGTMMTASFGKIRS